MIGYVALGTDDLDRARAFCGGCFRDPDGHKFCAFRIGPAD